MKPKRDIRFVSDDGDGYRPATRQGCRAFVAMFVAGGAGLAVFARTVRRHS